MPSSLVNLIIVMHVFVGQRNKNRGEVQLGYGRACFGAFKY